MILQKKSPKKSATAAFSAQGKILALVGPTAAGKTDIALKLAEVYPVEVICADSRTIYRGMDIGTAKPTFEEQALVPHWGLDLVRPGEAYSVAEFVNYAEQKMLEIWSRGNAVILVGGSGMYIDAVLFGYKFRNLVANQQGYASMSHDELVVLAKSRYPAEIKYIDVKNTRRLIQLLERGPANSADRDALKYTVKIIGIDPGKENLQIRIVERADEMLNQGFVQECETLVERYGADCPTFQTTGYSAVINFLEDQLSFEDMRTKIISDTKKLAKKQRTWFRRNPHIHWISQQEEVLAVATSYLQA